MNNSVARPANKEKSRLKKRHRNAPLAQIIDETSISFVFSPILIISECFN